MKKRVQDVMSKDLVTVRPESTLREVVDLLQARHISGAPVVATAGRLVGVISATDVFDFLSTNPGARLPTPEPSGWEAPADDAEPPGAPDEAPGMYLDFWGDAEADVLERFAHSTGHEWDILAEHTADEIMTRRLITLPPDADVTEAGRLLRERGIHRILIVDGERLAGVVTAHDLLPLLES